MTRRVPRCKLDLHNWIVTVGCRPNGRMGARRGLEPRNRCGKAIAPEALGLPEW